MSIIAFAKQELDAIGMTENSEDEMNREMRKHLLHMVEEFTKEGHSGYSASYAVNILSKLLMWKPLSPITGDSSEWVEVYENEQGPVFQNKRCSHVFKEADGRAYDSEGKVFWELNEDGVTKCYFTNSKSRVYITFPYTPTKVYEEASE